MTREEYYRAHGKLLRDIDEAYFYLGAKRKGSNAAKNIELRIKILENKLEELSRSIPDKTRLLWALDLDENPIRYNNLLIAGISAIMLIALKVLSRS